MVNKLITEVDPAMVKKYQWAHTMAFVMWIPISLFRAVYSRDGKGIVNQDVFKELCEPIFKKHDDLCWELNRADTLIARILPWDDKEIQLNMELRDEYGLIATYKFRFDDQGIVTDFKHNSEV